MVILPVTSCPGSRYDVRLLAVFRYRLSWFGLRNFANSHLLSVQMTLSKGVAFGLTCHYKFRQTEQGPVTEAHPLKDATSLSASLRGILCVTELTENPTFSEAYSYQQW